MGCLTAKASGEIASFINPTVTPIESARVYFSPTQLGEGTPSPDNVREIVGRTEINFYHSGKNLAHIIGYSAINSDSNNTRKISNSYGTTINTTEFSLPDTKLVITQAQYPNVDNPVVYQNGYVAVLVDNLIWEQKYNISFKIDSIVSNPLNVSLNSIRLIVPNGKIYVPTEIKDNRLFFKNVVWKPNSTNVNRRSFEIRICGMSFTLSEFMVTPVEDKNYDFKPYQGTAYSIDWTDDVGNIYGGYVDLAKGELVETYNNVVVDFLKDWESTSNYLYRKDNLPPSIGGRDGYVKTLCSHTKNPYDVTTAVVVSTIGYVSFGKKFFESANIEMTSEALNQYLEEQNNNGTPLQICYLLATPITHQLTLQQLQTFKNENNIWSNGDSVEIDYDLAETFDIQKAKRKIIMNQPHVETLTGDAVSFTTDMKAPLKECKVSFMPVQEGSGDPSPTNVRNITGWTGVSVKNGENTYSVDWTDDAGTVYGGYVDLVSGELVATYYSFTLDGINYFVISDGRTYTGTDGSLLAAAYDYIGSNSFKDLPMGVTDSIPNSISNKYLVTGNHKIIGIQTANAGTPYYRLVVGASELDDISNRTAIINSLKIWLQNNPIQICYKLAEPITYQLTPQQILSLKGINNFSCGIKNDMTVKYWNHKLSDSANIAYEAENLTFDGTNYIDTGVYLFSEENINRDFEVVIEDLYGSSNTYQHQTIVCAKYDSTAIGFLIRLNSQTSAQYNGTIGMKKDNHNNITIKRINGVITIDGEVITNPTVKFTNTIHNHPLVLGCALEDNGTPMRYATGTIGHITVKWL